MPDRATLLLCPGLLCDGALWEPTYPAIQDIARPLVADLAQDDSIAAMAARALDSAPLRFALAGLSMGGYVALEIMRQAPERVRALALLDTSARADTPEQSRRRRLLMALAETGQFRGVTPRLLPQLVHPSRIHGPLGLAVMAMAERIGRDAFLRQQRAIMGRVDSRPHLPAIEVPTLVAVGSEDVLTPPVLSEEIAAGIPGAKLVRFAGSGHLPTMEVPDEAGAALRAWLLDAL